MSSGRECDCRGCTEPLLDGHTRRPVPDPVDAVAVGLGLAAAAGLAVVGAGVLL